MTSSTVLLIFVAAIILFVIRAVRTVPQGSEYTVERFGRYMRTLTPGLHIIIPIVDRIGAKVNMKEMVMEVPSQDVITKDNAAVVVDGIVFFQVLACVCIACMPMALSIASKCFMQSDSNASPLQALYDGVSLNFSQVFFVAILLGSINFM